MPEHVPFSEDILWELVLKDADEHVTIKAIQVPAVHIDYHSPYLPRFRVFQWAVLSPARFHSRTIRQAFWNMFRTVGWNMNVILEAIKSKDFMDDMEYKRDQWS